MALTRGGGLVVNHAPLNNHLTDTACIQDCSQRAWNALACRDSLGCGLLDKEKLLLARLNNERGGTLTLTARNVSQHYIHTYLDQCRVRGGASTAVTVRPRHGRIEPSAGGSIMVASSISEPGRLTGYDFADTPVAQDFSSCQ